MRIRRRGGRHDQIENARDEFGDSRRLLSQRGSAYATDPDVALQAMKSQVYSTGPNGEKASPASEVALTPEELERAVTILARLAPTTAAVDDPERAAGYVA